MANGRCLDVDRNQALSSLTNRSEDEEQCELQSKDLGTRWFWKKTKGHAVVLIKCDPTSLTFINSWGTTFADRGFFRVRNQAVLKLEFYDVYWTLDDLKESERQAFRKKSSEKAQHLIEKLPPDMQNSLYECPECHEPLPVMTFIIHFSDVECPKCHHHFKPTLMGLKVTAYTD